MLTRTSSTKQSTNIGYYHSDYNSLGQCPLEATGSGKRMVADVVTPPRGPHTLTRWGALPPILHASPLLASTCYLLHRVPGPLWAARRANVAWEFTPPQSARGVAPRGADRAVTHTPGLPGDQAESAHVPLPPPSRRHFLCVLAQGQPLGIPASKEDFLQEAGSGKVRRRRKRGGEETVCWEKDGRRQGCRREPVGGQCWRRGRGGPKPVCPESRGVQGAWAGASGSVGPFLTGH